MPIIFVIISASLRCRRARIPRRGQPALPGEQAVGVHHYPGQAETVEIGITVIQPEPDSQAGGNRTQPRDGRPAVARCETGRLTARDADSCEPRTYPGTPVIKAGTTHSHAVRAPGRAVPSAGKVTAPCRSGMSRSNRFPACNAAAQAMTVKLAKVRAQRRQAFLIPREGVQAAQALGGPAADLRQGEHAADESRSRACTAASRRYAGTSVAA